MRLLSFDRDLPPMALFKIYFEMFGGKNLLITLFKTKTAKKAKSQTHASTQTHFASSKNTQILGPLAALGQTEHTHLSVGLVSGTSKCSDRN